MTNWYVDNSVGGPGTGTSADPFKFIQSAFNFANPDDHVKIRTGLGTYTEMPTLTRSGTSGHPIIVEPDTGNTPNLIGSSANPGAALSIRASYVTVQNLTFDGTGVWSRYGIRIEPSTTATITGVTITNCTITAMGGTEAQADDSTAAEGGILVRNTFGTQWTVDGFTISNNTFNNNRGQGMFLSGVLNGTVSGNTITNMLRGRTSDGIVEIGIKLASDNSAPAPSNNAMGHVISSNLIHDFQEVSAWTLASGAVGANIVGIYADVNVTNVTVQDNTIYKIAEATTSNTPCGGNVKCSFVNVIGVFPESRCANWVIQRNVIYRIGKNGIRNGSTEGTNVANSTQYLNNTIFKCGVNGFDIRGGSTLTFINNIAYMASASAVCINFQTLGELNTYGPHTINFNDWYNSASSNIATIGGTSYTFTTWKAQLGSQTGKDANSINLDPLFVSITSGSEDFHLITGSPCISTGFNNATMGALPFVSVTNVATNAVGDSTFSLTWTSGVAATTQTTFGTTTSYNGFTGKAPTLVTSHADSIYNLTPNTLYHFRALSSGGSSADQTIITNLPQPTNMRRKTTYYVATTGSDANPGTITQPFRTIAKGLTLIHAGDILYLRAGTYLETINSNNQTIPTGTSWNGAPLIASYPGETAIIKPTGAEAIMNLAHPYIKYVRFERLTIDGSASVPYAISLYGGANHVRFADCEIRNTQRDAILVVPANGLQSSFNEFLRLIVHDVGTLGSNNGHAFYISDQNTLIDHCEIYNTVGNGVAIYEGDPAYQTANNTISNNRIHNIGTSVTINPAGIGIASGNNNIAFNNIIYNLTQANDEGIVVGFGGPHSGNKIYNNTFYNFSNTAIEIRPDQTGVIVQNNIMYLTGGINNLGSGNVIDHNLTTDPSFVNAGTGDFHLQAGSAAIGAGVNLSSVFTTDFDGVTRPSVGAWDDGAYQKV